MKIRIIVELTFMYYSTYESWEQIKTIFENIDGKNLLEGSGYGKTFISSSVRGFWGIGLCCVFLKRKLENNSAKYTEKEEPVIDSYLFQHISK